MNLNLKQKDLLAEILKDTATFAIAGLVFGQITTKDVDPLIVLLGFLLYIWLSFIAITLKRRQKV